MDSQSCFAVKRTLAFVLVLLCGLQRADGDVIKFMTYNVQAPGWNQNRRVQVVGAIDSEMPDVLGLHEVSATGNGIDLMADLIDDYEPFLTETTEPIYLRRDRSFQVINQGVESLSTASSAVDLVWLSVETPEGARFVFYNTHFSVTFGSNDPVYNQMQAIETATFMANQAVPGAINILAGDLNANQTSPTVEYLLDGVALDIEGELFGNPIDLEDSWELSPGNAGLPRPGTGVSGSGSNVIDWLMTDPLANVFDAEVIQFDIPPGQEANFSDHFPVTATLDIFSLAGDFDDNGFVDHEDLLVWEQGFGASYDGSDFLRWQRNLGAGTPPESLSSLHPIPEPSSAILFAFAVTSNWVLMRRSRRGLKERFVAEL